MPTTFIAFFNFSILVILLVVKLKQPIRDFLKQRHETVRDEIKAVREQLAQANSLFDEFSVKLNSLDQESLALKEQTKQDIAAMRVRILTETQRLSNEAISDAKAASVTLFHELKNELFSEISYQILDRTEVLLRERLTGEDRIRIQNEFSQQLEAV